MIFYNFTPKKFLDVLYLRGIKLTHLVSHGVERSYFIPRYKEGSRKLVKIDYGYRKNIRFSSIEKISALLVQWGIARSKEQVVECFKNDDFDTLLPEDLL